MVDTKVKDSALFIFIVLTILCFILAFNANMKAQKYKLAFEKETAFRFDLDERVNKLMSERLQLTSILKERDSEIQKNKELTENLNQVISKQEKEIAELKDEFKKEILLKEKLEDNLKEELYKQTGPKGK